MYIDNITNTNTSDDSKQHTSQDTPYLLEYVKELNKLNIEDYKLEPI